MAVLETEVCVTVIVVVVKVCVVTVAVIVFWKIKLILMRDQLTSNSTETSCRISFRMLVMSRRWVFVLLHFLCKLTLMLKLDIWFSHFFLLHRHVSYVAVFARPFHFCRLELCTSDRFLLS